jgi:tetratricopeptide (TPR) repeat protein
MRLPGLALLLMACAARVIAQNASGQHAERAAEFAQHGDFKSAETELREALALTPDDPALLTSLGGILGMEGRLQEANSFFARAVKLSPQDPLLRRNLAANEWQLGRLQQAQADLEQILHANPTDKGAIFLLGMVSENERDYARSIALLESIPEIAERQPEVYVALASSYYHTNQPHSAQSALKQLLGRSAKVQVMLTACRVAMDAHDYPIALEIATAATEHFPRSYEPFLTKTSAEIKLRYLIQAVSSAKKAVALHPSAETKRELAFAEWQAGNRKDAISALEEILRQFPRDAGTYETYGGLLLEDGAPEAKTRAIGLLKKAIALDNSSFEACYQLGKAELSDGQLEAARIDLERAIQLSPADSRPHFAMSRVYRRLGLNSEADRELEQYQKLKATEN